MFENAVSVAHRKLPPVPVGLKPDATTICLCYQYKEPAWNKKQHKAAITEVQRLARLHNVKGRGRCAPEGLNCTLTANAKDMRAFCYALRAWDPIFAETDFKVSMIPMAPTNPPTSNKPRLCIVEWLAASFLITTSMNLRVTVVNSSTTGSQRVLCFALSR